MDDSGEFDAYEDVFMIDAHDCSLFDVVGSYPQRANNWKEKLRAKDDVDQRSTAHVPPKERCRAPKSEIDLQTS